VAEVARPDLTGGTLARLNQASGGEAAARYVELGWPVVPVAGMVGDHCGCRARAGCEHPAKHPLTPGGITAATTDPAQVAEWWGHWPWAGVGLITGSRSGLVAMDVDAGHGGRESLAQLRAEGLELPRTLHAATGGGGWHLFYAHPGPGTHIGNAIGRLGTHELAGIDLRADGGYVVAAPSGHRSGGRYAWRDTADALAAMPALLAERAEVGSGTPLPRPIKANRLAAYGAVALEGECRRVATAPQGDGNRALNLAALSLGTLVPAVLSEDAVVEALSAAVVRANQTRDEPMGPREAMRTIRSGLEAGMKRPRQLEQPSTAYPRLSPTSEPPPVAQHSRMRGPRL